MKKTRILVAVALSMAVVTTLPVFVQAEVNQLTINLPSRILAPVNSDYAVPVESAQQVVNLAPAATAAPVVGPNQLTINLPSSILPPVE